MKDKMLQLKKWAVLGATDDESKFGYRILKRLHEKEYIVYGLNPKYEDIDGIPVFNSVEDLPEKVDVVNVIVNPKIAMGSLAMIKEAGIENVWFQPGSFNEEVIERAKELGFNVEYDHCAFVELGNI
ncbi:MAG: CoA-binding protein [Clostridium sp.]